VWLGKCIAMRNYKPFLALITTLSIAGIGGAVSLAVQIYYTQEAIWCLCCLLVFLTLVLYLTAYHFALLWHNETTYERIKLIIRELPRNPFAMEY
jgi:hypothetical protein